MNVKKQHRRDVISAIGIFILFIAVPIMAGESNFSPAKIILIEGGLLLLSVICLWLGGEFE